MSRNVTLKDIARKTNLSIGAVSKALSGYPQVNKETRKRVQAACESLNYQVKTRSTHSSRIRRGVAQVPPRINLVLTEQWGARSALWTPALAKASQRVGLRLEISYVELGGSPSATYSDLETQRLNESPLQGQTQEQAAASIESWNKAIELQSQNVQGLLLFGCFDQQHLQILSKLNIPAVVMGDISLSNTDQALPVHLVSADTIAMGLLATQNLFNQGHVRIGFFCGKHPIGGWNHQWLVGYRLALMQARMSIDAALIHTLDIQDPVQISQAAADHFAALAQPPTAYVTPSINVAANFLKAMNKKHISIAPEQLVIAGHTDDALAHGLHRHLLLDEPVENMAIHALDLIARLIENDALPKAKVCVPFTIHQLPD